MTALVGTLERAERRGVTDPYLTKGIEQEASVLNLVHIVGARGKPFDGGK